MTARTGLTVLHSNLNALDKQLVFQSEKDGVFIIDEIKFDGTCWVLYSTLTSEQRAKVTND